MPSMAGDDMALGAGDTKDTLSLEIPGDFFFYVFIFSLLALCDTASCPIMLQGSACSSSIPGWLIGDI